MFYGHRDAVRCLLEAGADPNLRAFNGFTSFDLVNIFIAFLTSSAFLISTSEVFFIKLPY